jgi:hypothetical protein
LKSKQQNSFFLKSADFIKSHPHGETRGIEELCICFLTIKALRAEFYGVDTNLTEDYTYDSYRDFLIPDFNKVIMTLINFRGKDRVGVNEAKKEMDYALEYLYRAFSTVNPLGKPDSQKQKNDRVSNLLNCRRHIDRAYSHLEHLSEHIDKLYGH